MEKSKRQKRIKMRLGTVLLSLIVAVTMMPAFAFADEESYDDTLSAYDEYAEDISEAGETDEEMPADIEEISGFELIDTEDMLPDSEDLLKDYIDTGVDAETGTELQEHAVSGSGSMEVEKKKAKLAIRRNYLNTGEKAAYDQIKPYIQSIAAGNLDNAAFYVTDRESVSFKNVISALMTDMPYEFYWYDKVEGYLHGSVSGNRHLFIFSVSKDYWDPSIVYNYRGTDFVYGLNTVRTKKASQAVTNVSHIINEFADKSDIDKLYGYRNRVCEFAEYDWNAAFLVENHGSDPFYGDPWQLISVFDGDDDTQVVCEGYSKAFQYLCDRTKFGGGIECYTVQGYLYNGSSTKGEGHMWNILHMNDGGNYIADLTNSDITDPDVETYFKEDVFLTGWKKGTAGSVQTGYTYDRRIGNTVYGTIRYEYDDFTKGTNGAGGMFTERELTLSDQDYKLGTITVSFCPAKEPTCTTPGNIDRWLLLGYYFLDEDCTQKTTYKDSSFKPLGHAWGSGTVTRKATENSEGIKRYVCSRCHEVKEERLGKLPHTHRYTAVDTLDYVIYKCACGNSYTRSKVIFDLPKVSIRKPSGSKAGFTAKWKKLSAKKRKKIKGYEIQYSTRSDFADSSCVLKTAAKSKTGKKITKLARKKNYYIRIRSYKWIGGVKHVSRWSSVKRVRTK